MAEIEKRPFHCGSQAADWQELNCERCLKSSTEKGPGPCEIEKAINEAWWGDGRVSMAIAERMGFLDNSPPRQDGFSYNWKCKEFEERK